MNCIATAQQRHFNYLNYRFETSTALFFLKNHLFRTLEKKMKAIKEEDLAVNVSKWDKKQQLNVHL